jgi:hypothetical protein
MNRKAKHLCNTQVWGNLFFFFILNYYKI